MDPNDISKEIVDAAIKVHSHLGPGLLESAYEGCLAYELTSRGIPNARQMQLPIRYSGVQIDAGYRIDLLVADLVIVEVKAVSQLAKIHEAQLITYLKLSALRLGLLLNFKVLRMKDGIKRMVNGLEDMR